ncbi:translation initiation factor IF-2-like [Ornithorhynchus anatinus]|uniref:translation initiation factor IF-2-like n=1 Tax=Ornithorhynchus anatinus TaxID=9258 RepID=UPI0010A7E2FA|nr:translation initiation factor IF-2-like [Ornithorhynchus anatinus]
MGRDEPGPGPRPSRGRAEAGLARQATPAEPQRPYPLRGGSGPVLEPAPARGRKKVGDAVPSETGRYPDPHPLVVRPSVSPRSGRGRVSGETPGLQGEVRLHPHLRGDPPALPVRLSFCPATSPSGRDARPVPHPDCPSPLPLWPWTPPAPGRGFPPPASFELLSDCPSVLPSVRAARSPAGLGSGAGERGRGRPRPRLPPLQEVGGAVVQGIQALRSTGLREVLNMHREGAALPCPPLPCAALTFPALP